MRRARRRELVQVARTYIGTLVAEVVNSYTAFEDLPEDEQAFLDGYIREFGQRVQSGGRG